MAILKRDEFEAVVRDRAERRWLLKQLRPLSELREALEALHAAVERATENVRIYKASDDQVRIPIAEAELVAAEAERELAVPDLEAELEAVKLKMAEHREAIMDADVEIETAREVIGVFGEGE